MSDTTAAISQGGTPSDLMHQDTTPDESLSRHTPDKPPLIQKMHASLTTSTSATRTKQGELNFDPKQSIRQPFESHWTNATAATPLLTQASQLILKRSHRRGPMKNYPRRINQQSRQTINGSAHRALFHQRSKSMVSNMTRMNELTKEKQISRTPNGPTQLLISPIKVATFLNPCCPPKWREATTRLKNNHLKPQVTDCTFSTYTQPNHT